MVARGVAELKPSFGSILIIQNVGNLVCPALFDLGERAKVAIIRETLHREAGAGGSSFNFTPTAPPRPRPCFEAARVSCFTPSDSAAPPANRSSNNQGRELPDLCRSGSGSNAEAGRLDSLGSHKGKAMRRAVRATGARLLFLPPYSPDLNPIEQVFAKLKHLMLKAKERTVDASWKRSGPLLETSKSRNAKTTSPMQATLHLKMITL
jgi:hypothetical protein